MKRGFTLIELLAVIVILAIIALIATPIVLNIINETKESANLRSAEFYMGAVENSIAMQVLKGKTLNGDYYITKDGDLCKEPLTTDKTCPDNKAIIIEVSGEKPNGGMIWIENGNIEEITLKLNEKTIAKTETGELVYYGTLADLCEFKTGTEMTIGAKYSCDFGGGARDFYILEKGTNRVTGSTLKTDEVALILDGNYDETTLRWCASEDDDTFCNADGLTSKLDEIASAWTKLDRSQIVLPSAKQIVVADGLSEDAYDDDPKLTNSWLYIWTGNDDYNNNEDTTNYGYWTSTAEAEYPYPVNYISTNGYVWVQPVFLDPTHGVRPVINLKL